MSISPRQAVTAQVAVDFLNSLLIVDRDAITRLISAHVPCNAAMADHPTVQVDVAIDRTYSVGVLGVLNGMIGVDWGSRGYIIARFNGGHLADFSLREPEFTADSVSDSVAGD